MYSYKNARFHDEIRKWNTKQLIEVLESNGLGDCTEAVKTRQIDGDTFMNLTEGQLAFWRNNLSNVQIKRLWSYIQLARDKPQDFITNLPPSKRTSSETLNTRKADKIKSPIADSLNNLFGQQNNPASVPVDPPQQSEIPEGNYPKHMPPLNPNNFQQRIPSRPNILPPKPLNFQNKREVPVPPATVVTIPPDISFRPPVTIPQPFSPPISSYPKPPGILSFPQHQQHEDDQDIYEPEPNAQPQNDFEPFQLRLPPNPSSIYKPPPPKPMFEPPLPTGNTSSIYKVPPSNPIPIRKEPPLPTNYGRPLPLPPTDETPFRLPPNVVPIKRNARSPQPPDVSDFPRNLPRSPVFRPPPNIPDFDHKDHCDEDQVEYDFVDEAQIPEYRRQSWFKNIERREAGKLLRGRPNGTFIARPSKQPDYECTFSVIYDTKIYNLPVMKENGKVVLGKNAFISVMDIVEKFFENPLVLNGPNNEDVYVTLKKY